MFVFPVDHGCTGFGSHQEGEFKWQLLKQFFTLIMTVEFVFLRWSIIVTVRKKTIAQISYFDQDFP